jgi:hypothetical protein
MQLEWIADGDFRFFPAQPDEFFGFVPHPLTWRRTKRRRQRTGVNPATSSTL